MITYRPTHFTLQELVDPDTYESLGQKAWLVLDPRALTTLDRIRARFGPCTVNNWNDGGRFKYRGFRPRYCIEGAPFSQHRFGRAFDLHSNTPAHEMREYILSNRDEFPHLSTLEVDVDWLHFDVRDHGGHNIKMIKRSMPTIKQTPQQ